MNTLNKDKISLDGTENDIFLKCLLQYYENNLKNSENIRKLKLRDSILTAYNTTYKTELKPAQLMDILEKNENIYQPHEWQKMFLDEFKDSENTNQVNTSDTSSELQQAIKKGEGSMQVDEKPKSIVPETDVPADVSADCTPDISALPIESDYKTMSLYELKRALLVSKLEMLEAQEAVKRAKENIRLNEEEHSNRRIDKTNQN